MCFIGDGNNMANSLIVGGLKVGMNVAVATPDGYKPDGAVLEFTKGYGDKFALETDPFMAASGADILITDTWTSMGEEAEKEERKKIFKDYQINRQLRGRKRGRYGPALSPGIPRTGDHRGSLRGTCRRDLQ